MDRGLVTRDSCEGMELGGEASVAAAAPATPETSQPPAAAQVPQHLCCPVSLELMQDPVVVATGAQGLCGAQQQAGSHKPN